MATDQQRRERVRQGSRRKRDLAAVPTLGFSGQGWQLAVAWAEEKLPDQDTSFTAAACLTYGALHGGRYPSPELVLERLEEQGRDAASLDRRLA